MLLINDLTRHTQACKSEVAAAVTKVLESGWFVLGPETKAFEIEFAAYCAVGHCVGVGNGTEALELALRALNVGAGDGVACVANAGGYGLHAINAVGALPLFVDVDAGNMNMAPELLTAALASAKVKAVIFTHLYGNMAGIEAVAATCAAAGVPLIEDCAQAHGAVTAGLKAGAWGALACFSFYPTKNLGALGDGGAVVTSDPALDARLRQLRQYGWGATKYVSELPGSRNSRLDEMQAAILRVKLPNLDDWNERRRHVAQRYATGLDRLPLTIPMTADQARQKSYVAHLYVLRVEDRETLRSALKAEGIASDVHYPIPDHRQPSCPTVAASVSLPVTERLAREVMTLPCYPEMADSDADKVISAATTWANHRSNDD